MSRGLPAPLLAKYFRRAGASWQLNDDVRSLVSFRTLNLLEPLPPLLPADIVLLRNVLIYFDVPTKKAILGRVPADRLGTPEEIASGVVYLASDEAGYVTGQTLHINGGMAMI